MNVKDLIGENYSRKAAVVIVAISALVYVATFQVDEGKVINPEIIKWAILGIIWVGSLGIFAQAVIDWRKPKVKKAVSDDETVDEPQV